MPSILDIARGLSRISVVGGVALTAGTPTTQVTQIQQQMISTGILPQASAPVGTFGALGDIPQEVLSALNLTVDYTTDRTFSLLTTETDTEVIENPNIIDTVKWEETVNADILTTTSFPSTTDNFFTLDAGPDEATKKQRERIEKTKDKKDLTNLTADLLNYNLIDSTRPTLPQFKR
jgi:hypothetical protein